MSASARSFSVGSVLMAVFIFFITGLFSWFGNTTLDNHTQSIQTVLVLKQLNKTLIGIDRNIQHLNSKIEKVAMKTVENEKKIYKLSVDVHK